MLFLLYNRYFSPVVLKYLPQHPIPSCLLVSKIFLSILSYHTLKTFLLQRETKGRACFKQEVGAVIKMVTVFYNVT
jgi:hypothetical protein